MMDVTYQILLSVFTVAAWWILHRRPRIMVLAAAVALFAVMGCVIAYKFTAFRSGFDFLRLLNLAIFVHGTALLAGCTWIFRRHRIAALLLAATLTVPSVGAYATWIEPQWLEVSRVEIQSAKLDRPIRVAVLADLQAEEFGVYERRVLEATLAEKPDLILLPGDYFQVDGARWPEVSSRFRDYLHSSGFGAPLGAFAVRGDVELSEWPSLFAGTGVTAIDPPEGAYDTLRLAGLDVTALSRRASRDTYLGLPPRDDRFHIVFGHAPDFALGEVPADLLIAGHVHGGQVRLPFFGPPITFTDVPRSWAVGVTHLEGDRTLVVSRGVGMERGPAPRLRFLCRPEIVVIDLMPSPEA